MDSAPIAITININQPTLEGSIMTEIDRLATAIAAEVAEAVTAAQSRIDDALAAAAASEEARAAVQAELDALKSRATTLAESVEAEGLYGQAVPEPEPEAPENPEAPAEPEAPTEEPAPAPTEPENPSDPGSVVF